MRDVEQGNILWKWYYLLTRQLQNSLLTELTSAGWAKTTFFADTQKERPLSTMPYVRLTWYSKWFKANAPMISECLMDLAAAETEQKAVA